MVAEISLTMSPILSQVLLASKFRLPCNTRVILITDRSWLLDVRIAKNRSDWMSKPLSAIQPCSDVILVPGEDSSTGNITGGCKPARCVFFDPEAS